MEKARKGKVIQQYPELALSILNPQMVWEFSSFHLTELIQNIASDHSKNWPVKPDKLMAQSLFFSDKTEGLI